jgi:hypothetical protein
MDGDPMQLPALCAAFNAPMPAPSISNEHLTVNAVPFLGGRALRIVHRASGECVTAFNTTRNLMFPFCGGEETRLGGVFDALGTFAQFLPVTKTDASITLAAEAGGFKVQRTLTLVPGAPKLNIRVELTNTTDKPREAVIHSHMELDLGDVHETRVHFTNRAGQTVDKDMKPIVAGLREGEHYTDQNTPNGAWTFTGTKGLQVTQTFDPAATDFTWLYAYPDYLNELEVEIWARRANVPAKDTLAFSYDIEVQTTRK